MDTHGYSSAQEVILIRFRFICDFLFDKKTYDIHQLKRELGLAYNTIKKVLKCSPNRFWNINLNKKTICYISFE
jgi:hypothetical protein